MLILLVHEITYPLSIKAADITYTDNVWMAVFFDTFVDGTFRLMYSTTVNLVGPWSPEMDLYQTSAESGYYNYGGHAYPGLGAGKNLLLSWTWGTNVTQMANVTFA